MVFEPRLAPSDCSACAELLPPGRVLVGIATPMAGWLRLPGIGALDTNILGFTGGLVERPSLRTVDCDADASSLGIGRHVVSIASACAEKGAVMAPRDWVSAILWP